VSQIHSEENMVKETQSLIAAETDDSGLLQMQQLITLNRRDVKHDIPWSTFDAGARVSAEQIANDHTHSKTAIVR